MILFKDIPLGVSKLGLSLVRAWCRIEGRTCQAKEELQINQEIPFSEWGCEWREIHRLQYVTPWVMMRAMLLTNHPTLVLLSTPVSIPWVFYSLLAPVIHHQSSLLNSCYTRVEVQRNVTNYRREYLGRYLESLVNVAVVKGTDYQGRYL